MYVCMYVCTYLMSSTRLGTFSMASQPGMCVCMCVCLCMSVYMYICRCVEAELPYPCYQNLHTHTHSQIYQEDARHFCSSQIYVVKIQLKNLHTHTHPCIYQERSKACPQQSNLCCQNSVQREKRIASMVIPPFLSLGLSCLSSSLETRCVRMYVCMHVCMYVYLLS
jgi:hypothetical protein